MIIITIIVSIIIIIIIIIITYSTISLTYSLTPWSRVLLEKLTINFAASQEIPHSTILVAFEKCTLIKLPNPKYLKSSLFLQECSCSLTNWRVSTKR
jgi:hypothetical protein